MARKSYTSKQKTDAVEAVRNGATIADVSEATEIPERNVQRWVAADKAWVAAGNDEPLQYKTRRGPDPLLSREAEDSIYEWVIGRQLVGAPVNRQDIIRQASEVSKLVSGSAVGEGWYRRFLQRYPQLTGRVSQSVSKVRNMVTDEDVQTLFSSLAKPIIENNMHGSRIFNIDETAFESSRKTTRVVVLRGSKNVWHSDPTTSFHLSFVACGSAAGFVVPPLFILPGERVDNVVLDGCDIPGAAVTTTEKAFMTAPLFRRWLEFFADAVPSPVMRPLLLLMDGCSSHLSLAIIDTAELLRVKLVCLPANGTHLLQPLDVAVFSSFKSKLKVLIDELIRDNGETNIKKAKALQIATLAWTSCNFDTNISAGFRSCGIFPLNIQKMSEKLHNFQRNGAPVTTKKASWLRYKETIQHDILLLPRQTTKGKKRKTSTVAGRLLTREMLQQSSPPNQASKRKAKAKKQTKPKHVPVQGEQDPVLYEAIV